MSYAKYAAGFPDADLDHLVVDGSGFLEVPGFWAAPQTNGKVERFHRTLTDGWAFGRFYSSEAARRKALPAWLHHYNHHRPHTATGGKPPVTRLTNVPGQYT